MLTDPAICGRGPYFCSRFESTGKAARLKLNLSMSEKNATGCATCGKG